MKYTEQKVKEICGYLKCGSTAKNACQLSDIREETYYTWIKEKPEFSESVEHAKAEFHNDLVQNVVQAGKTDWRASAWMLEHKFSEEYSVQHKLDIKKTKEAERAEEEKARREFHAIIPKQYGEALSWEREKPENMSWKDYFKSRGYHEKDAEILGLDAESNRMRLEMLYNFHLLDSIDTELTKNYIDISKELAELDKGQPERPLDV